MNARGFTVIELLVVTVLLVLIGLIFWSQKSNIEVASRDDARKVAINAMYYSLEEIYYKQNGAYPNTLGASVLPSVDKALFVDPNGKTLNTAGADYRYEPLDCEDTKCKAYSLRANLENEADFVKKSRSH